MAEPLPPPIPLSLVVCESHLVDARTGQHSLIGIVSHVQAPRFPVMVPRLCCFAEVTSARGRWAMGIRIVDVDEARPPVALAEMELESNDPLMIHQLAVGMGGLVFPEPGEYRVQLMLSGEVRLDRRIMLLPFKPPEQKPEKGV